MAITNSGMTLYTTNDSAESWSGTDGPDTYFVRIQGTNSQSWLVRKNSVATATLNKTANMSNAKYFTFYMASNLAPYYTSIKLRVSTNTSNYEEWVLATSSNRNISGDFHPIVVQFGQGTTTGTLNKASISSVSIILDNSSSGNIRSVINNWIDTMHYGSGRVISGSTDNNKLFRESHETDTTIQDAYDGCSELYKGALSFQTDLTINTTVGNSYGEIVNFAGGYNTDNSYTITITGAADWQRTMLIGVDGAKVHLNTTSATSFSMEGGGITNGGAILLASGQTMSNVVLNSCNNIVPNGATLSGVIISNTTETTYGALKITNASDFSNLTDITLTDFTGAYGIYIPATVTTDITLNNITSDGSGTDIFWAASSGTLNVYLTNGSNLSSVASNGGAVNVISSYTFTVENLIPGSIVTIYDDEVPGDYSFNTVLTSTQSSGSTFSFQHSGVTNDIIVQVLKDGYIELDILFTLQANNQSLRVTQQIDDND